VPLTHEQLDRIQIAFRLSPRERQIVDLLFQQVTTDAGLAERLGVTTGTVKAMVHDLLLKTNCPDKLTLVVRLHYALTR
jgi:DNA-binding NarL/FixJ family response regulator